MYVTYGYFGTVHGCLRKRAGQEYRCCYRDCFDLVKLNLQNPEVVNYLLDSVKGWIDEFGIDPGAVRPAGGK